MANSFNKISYYDLRHEVKRGSFSAIIGRQAEQARLTRVVNRKLANNALVAGQSGIGKTALLHGWLKSAADGLPGTLVQLETDSVHTLGAGNLAPAVLEKFQEAFSVLPPGLVVIDDFGALVYNRLPLLQNFLVILEPLLASEQIRVLLACEDQELDWILQMEPGFAKWFEILSLKNQSLAEQMEILKLALGRLQTAGQPVAVSEPVMQLICALSERYAKLGQAPEAGINILDECLAFARSNPPASEAGHKAEVSQETVYQIVADKTGIPYSQIAATEMELLKNLEAELNAVVIGQKQALAIVTDSIKRAKLGLKNVKRPLGSFLFLGPSGVGKTETCRKLAEIVFGRKETFVRLDMSELGQEHTVQRLLGAPPGYIGYETGGYLTNAVRDEPHSLVLLDEIEKAHPKAFDVFLQVLEDGRLTSGQGETIDFKQSIVMATSNLGVPEILAGWQRGEDIHSPEFLQQTIIPALSKSF